MTRETGTASGAVSVQAAGERLLLHPELAVVWPAERTLFVADTHFGKAAEFRRSGIALPSGSSARDLQRLGSLLVDYRIGRLVVLGDFVHGAVSAEEPFVAAFQRWRQTHGHVHIDVIRGNHDRLGAEALLPGLAWHDEALPAGPFVLRHRPEADSRGYVLAGHVHPAVRIGARAGDSIQLPAFRLGPGIATLPAFGSLTGGYRIVPKPGHDLYVSLGERVSAIA